MTDEMKLRKRAMYDSEVRWSWTCAWTQWRLKAYSLISYRGRSQKFQNLNFLHLFVAFLQKIHFPKGI